MKKIRWNKEHERICLMFWDYAWCVLFCNFSNYCPHLYCDMLKNNVSAAVYSDIPQMSLVYLTVKVLKCSFDSQTFKIISQVELFLCPEKQGTPEDGRMLQRPKRCVSTYHNKDEDNGPKNYNQNNKNERTIWNSRLWKKTAFYSKIYC